MVPRTVLGPLLDVLVAVKQLEDRSRSTALQGRGGGVGAGQRLHSRSLGRSAWVAWSKPVKGSRESRAGACLPSVSHSMSASARGVRLRGSV